MMMLTVIYAGSTEPVLLTGKDSRVIAAKPIDEVLLLALGDKLLEENIISAYQLVCNVGMPVTKILAGLEESE
jgi:hypothetical protein